jgi:hypothetical protein
MLLQVTKMEFLVSTAASFGPRTYEEITAAREAGQWPVDEQLSRYTNCGRLEQVG